MSETLVGMSGEELADLAERLGEPRYRGRQIGRWLYRRGAASFEEMTDLPAAFRQRLAERAAVGRPEARLTQRSRDGTVKALVGLADGETVETVYLPYEDRDSVCVSSQVGCPAACTFCATGALGLRRNLTAGEIAGQVLVANDLAAERSSDRRVDHVVLMGMGEPLLNYGPVLKAVHLINREIGIGMRSITLSTVGVTPAILRLARERLQLTLSLSLHAPDEETRRRIVPLAHQYPLNELLRACDVYTETTGRRITYEYVMLAGVNDSPEQAEGLARLLRGRLGHVNLIPFNPGPTLAPFRPPSGARIRSFRERLEAAGIPVTQRQTRGQDIDAACGQLKEAAEGRKPLLKRLRAAPAADPLVASAAMAQ